MQDLSLGVLAFAGGVVGLIATFIYRAWQARREAAFLAGVIRDIEAYLTVSADLSNSGSIPRTERDVDETLFDIPLDTSEREEPADSPAIAKWSDPSVAAFNFERGYSQASLNLAKGQSDSAVSTVAGISGGTGFTGLALLAPEGPWRNVLLLLAPSVSLVCGILWGSVIGQLQEEITRWELKRQVKRANSYYAKIANDPLADPELLAEAIKAKRAMSRVEAELIQKRASTFLKK